MIGIYMWDIFPILAIIALIIACIVKQRSMKREEEELQEVLASLTAERTIDSEEKTNENQ
ncbi:MAG: hypothetical protein IJI74_06155 [Firmicutes bacterium]|nr:hypothetical protein [Bacillota bacterium]